MEREAQVEQPAFGTLLRELRLEAGLSQELLAERAGISKQAVSSLERGVRKAPQRQTLKLIVGALKLSSVAEAELHAAARASAQSKIRRHAPSPARTGVPDVPPLTKHEIEIAQFVAGGKSDTEIAVALRRVFLHAPPSTRGAKLAARTNLSQHLKTLIGRSAEAIAIEHALESKRLVTVTGPAGVGKTQLAIQAASAALAHSDDGVWLVELAAYDRNSVGVAIADALSLGSQPNNVDDIADRIAEQRMLLLLDNCEHVIEAAADVAKTLLGKCPLLRILATSREPLKVGGELVYRLEPLPESAALELFVERARAIDQRFTLTASSEAHARQICRRLDGLPLAIEFAAARTNLLSLEQLALGLDRRLELLASGERTAAPRHRTLRALFDWSFQLLSEFEQRFFARLATLTGGGMLPMIVAISDVTANEPEVVRLLSSLIEKSLVVVELGDEPRYHLLESTRDYAREKLLEFEDQRFAARAHAAACLELAEQTERAYSAGSDKRWMDRVRSDLPNWRSALTWALEEANDEVLGQRLAGALRIVWANFGYMEGRRWVRDGLARVSAATPHDVIAQLELADAQISSGLGEIEAALDASSRAMTAYQNVADRLGNARAEHLAGRMLMQLGRLSDAKPLVERALSAAEGPHGERLRGAILETLARLHVASGDMSGARMLFAQASAVQIALGADLSAMIVGNGLADAEFCAGHPKAAIVHTMAVLARARGLDHEQMVVHALLNLAAYHIALDQFDDARDCVSEIIEFAGTLRNFFLTAAVEHLAAIAALRPAPDFALAATLLGFVDARHHGVREFTEQQEYERITATLDANLSSEERRALVLAGTALNETEIIAALIA